VLLRQVFANLVRNAAEACEGAGVVPVIEIAGSIDARRGTCRVTVADNGPGIPETERDRVFQPFFTTRSRGTGLGLAIVQKIVVTHNGRVVAGESASGGARIDMTFPLAVQT
jgi:two-component system sensor histidine kinase PilS (NtrC family)